MLLLSFFFFFNDTATTEIYTLSLHDALPIFLSATDHVRATRQEWARQVGPPLDLRDVERDRKSTRLNSSHSQISYAVFCLKKKKNKNITTRTTSLHLPPLHSTLLNQSTSSNI